MAIPAQCPACARFLSRSFVRRATESPQACPKCERLLTATEDTDEPTITLSDDDAPADVGAQLPDGIGAASVAETASAGLPNAEVVDPGALAEEAAVYAAGVGDDVVDADATAATPVEEPDATTDTDSSGTDSSGTDSSGTDSSGTDSSGVDSSGVDSSGSDSSGRDTAGTDPARTDSSDTGPAGTESPSTDRASTDSSSTTSAAGHADGDTGVTGSSPQGDLAERALVGDLPPPGGAVGGSPQEIALTEAEGQAASAGWGVGDRDPLAGWDVDGPRDAIEPDQQGSEAIVLATAAVTSGLVLGAFSGRRRLLRSVLGALLGALAASAAGRARAGRDLRRP